MAKFLGYAMSYPVALVYSVSTRELLPFQPGRACFDAGGFGASAFTISASQVEAV